MRLKNPVVDPRLLVQIEHVAQARGAGDSGRKRFMAELKRVDGNIGKMLQETFKDRQAYIEKADGLGLWENDQPTESHLALLMWGWTPDEKGVREWAESVSDRIFITENGLVNVWLPARAPLFEATMAQAIPAVHPVASTPVAPMKSASKSWLYKYHGGDWEVKSITSSGMRLTGNGILVHASKDLAHQINLPSISYFNRLAKRMGPPGPLAEAETPTKVRHDMGIVSDGDFHMDGYGINDTHPSHDGTTVGQRWKEPQPDWDKKIRKVGSHLPRDEGVFPMSSRGMLGLEE